MAKEKKSFLLYADLIHTVTKLPDKEAGMLLKTILSYVNDENPQVDNILVDVVFEPIKLQLKRDLEKWEEFRKKQSENGKLGGRPKETEKPENPSLLDESQKSLSVSATVTETVNATKKEEEAHTPVILINPIKAEKKKKEKIVAPQKEINKGLEVYEKSGYKPKDPKWQETWLTLCSTPKWNKKLNISLETSLKKLIEFEEQFAINLMSRAIEGNYQGVIYSDTHQQYEEYLQRKNGKINTGKPQHANNQTFGKL